MCRPQIAASASSINSDAVKADLHLRVADGFARLAAIERGLLLPPETGPDGERAFTGMDSK